MATDLFQDELVRATDLNRTSGEVLNKASRAPITIVRNDETFALMRREVATSLVQDASHAAHLVEIVWLAFYDAEALPFEYRWITAFDAGQKREMGIELMGAFRNASRIGNWEEFDAILHEWSESGWAALSPDLTEATNAATDLVEIQPPAYE
ncbi:MAG: hypothetical protein ABIQ44_02875 [Chloroflexia bacterium]